MTATHGLPRTTYRFTVDEVQRMVAAGLLADERVELLDGELVYMPAKGPLHVYVATGLHHRLSRALPLEWRAQKGDPVVASAVSAPEPDVAIVRGTERDYRSRLPTGADCVLVVEVAVSTLEQDRAKLPIYAGAGIPEVWILDVETRRLERYRSPRNGVYTENRVLIDSEDVDVPVIGERWSVASFLD